MSGVGTAVILAARSPGAPATTVDTSARHMWETGTMDENPNSEQPRDPGSVW